MSHKSWVFTINNYTDNDITWLQNLAKQVSRLVASKEVGGEEKTPHIQGEVTFNGSKRLAALKKLHARAHWEPKRSADWVYALKEDSDVVVNVNNSKQGKRTDLESFQEDVKEVAEGKKRYTELFDEHFSVFMKYRQGAAMALSHYRSRRKQNNRFASQDFKEAAPSDALMKAKAIVVLGDSGIGKTSWVRSWFANALFVSHIDELGSLNDEHDGVIFDDMDFRRWPRTSQIHLVDCDYDRAIHIRYQVAIMPAELPRVFTGNEYMFEEDAAIDRRVHKIDLHGNKLF